jgi:hypothetical protein
MPISATKQASKATERTGFGLRGGLVAAAHHALGGLNQNIALSTKCHLNEFTGASAQH